MLVKFPNEIIFKILLYLDENSIKNMKASCKDIYMLCKYHEYKQLLYLNKSTSNIIYKLCLNACVYPYNLDVNNMTKIDKLFVELKLRFLLTNNKLDNITNIFGLFYKSILQ